MNGKYVFVKRGGESNRMRWRTWSFDDGAISFAIYQSHEDRRLNGRAFPEITFSSDYRADTGDNDDFVDAYIAALTEARNLYRAWREDAGKPVTVEVSE